MFQLLNKIKLQNAASCERTGVEHVQRQAGTPDRMIFVNIIIKNRDNRV